MLFCDLVDSTRLARQRDPEDWRDVVRAYQQVCAAVIQRFDGYIAQYLGDGLLVYFGYPQAHEDDAQRAGGAGLGMLEGMRLLNIRLEQERGIRLAVCIGVHTGPVVVGAMGGGGRQEQLALGDTPNIAARLQGLAAPNTVVVSAATWGLIEGFFTCQALGEHTIKGVDEALVAWLVAEAEQQPVLAVWEDLHWADPSTLEWLGLVLDQMPTVPLCHLLTCRPEFPPPWALRSYLTQLTLARLTRPQVEEMVRRVTGGKSLSAEVVQQIVAKTDGVPLFVEELPKTVLESGWLREHEQHYALTGPLPPLAIPATLQDALMARLDRLADGKAVAQLGAVLGRTFAYGLLQAVAPLDELALWRGLVQLVQAEVLY